VGNQNDLAAALALWPEDASIKTKNGPEIKHKNQADHLAGLDEVEGLPPLISFKQQTRAFLKVQDGCDGYCSYCIVPKTRPVVRSKPAETALAEAQALVKSGHKEIVVSGVFLGAYGQKTVRRKIWPESRNDNLADLLDRLAQIPDLARVRLSSLEPADVTERLLDTLCRYPNIMPHLHLPLQSGSDSVLRRMCRQYNVAQFKRTVDSIQTRLDRPAITTDIIVGFPGETDADFRQTLDLARHVGFSKMHVFPFSPRRGTPAAGMPDIVEKRVCQQRSKILRDLDAELGLQYRRQFLGETAEVLIEPFGVRRPASNVPQYTTRGTQHTEPVEGRSERYFKVYLNIQYSSSVEHQGSRIVKVRLVENHQRGMVGTPLCCGSTGSPAGGQDSPS
jgi:threonylcarbamoyladenosine tRNA methylthiotransferase MtaB